MEAEVFEIRDHDFMGDDNRIVKGKYVYLRAPRADGTVETKRYFLGVDRLKDFAYQPRKGDKVLVFLNGNGVVVDMLKAG